MNFFMNAAVGRSFTDFFVSLEALDRQVLEARRAALAI